MNVIIVIVFSIMAFALSFFVMVFGSLVNNELSFPVPERSSRAVRNFLYGAAISQFIFLLGYLAKALT